MSALLNSLSLSLSPYSSIRNLTAIVGAYYWAVVVDVSTSIVYLSVDAVCGGSGAVCVCVRMNVGIRMYDVRVLGRSCCFPYNNLFYVMW